MSVSNSQNTYEASSSLFEAIHLQIYSPSSDRSTLEGLTPRQADFIRPLEHFIESTALPLTLCAPLVDAISRAALATHVLDHMRDYDDFNTTDWATYFEIAENSPDKRYRVLEARFSDENFVSLVANFVTDHFRLRFGTTEFKLILREVNRDSESLLIEHKLLTRKLLSLFSKELSFSIVNDSGFMAHKRLFLNSWRNIFQQLAVSPPHSPILTIPIRVPFADYFLNRTDCMPKKDRAAILQIAFPVPKKHLYKLWEFLLTLETPTYFHIRLVSESPVLRGDFSPDKHPPQHFSLFVQYSRINGGQLQFRSPIPDNSPYYKLRSCRFDLATADLSSVVLAMSRFSFIATITHKAFLTMKRSKIGTAALKLFDSPVIVIPQSSTLSHWRRVIGSYSIDNRAHLLHFQNLDPSEKTMDYCILIPSGARYIFARPTLYQVYQRLMEENQHLEPISDSIHLQKLFDAQWRDRVYLGLCHYYEYGY